MVLLGRRRLELLRAAVFSLGRLWVPMPSLLWCRWELARRYLWLGRSAMRRRQCCSRLSHLRFRLGRLFERHLEDRGVTMVTMHLVRDSTGDPRLRVADGDMPGRVMVRLRGLSWGRLVVLSKGRLGQLIVTEAVSADIMAEEAEEVGTVQDNIILRLRR